MRFGKMHLFTRIALLVAFVSVAKCSILLDGISQEHRALLEEKGISLDHESHREGKRLGIKQRTNLAPILDSLLGIIDLNSIIDFDSGNCTTGKCMSQKDCSNMNGTYTDLCVEGYGVCCITTGDEEYGGGDTEIGPDGGPFFNPPSTETEGAPRQDDGGVTYSATITPPADAVQIVVDIETLDILGPVDGECDNDTLSITGANPGLEIPVLCGVSSNQKLYVDIDNSEGPFVITAALSGVEATRSWKIFISYLTEADAVERRCLQYHTATEGTIESFNFGGDPPMAINDQTYSICFGYVVGYCDIAFSFSRLDLGNINGNCVNDYLLVGDDKICGDFAEYSVTANATGPINVGVRTDSDNEMQAEGFSATYMMLPC